MIKIYIKTLLKMHPDIASGRKNFNYFERRVKKNIVLTKKYNNKKKQLIK